MLFFLPGKFFKNLLGQIIGFFVILVTRQLVLVCLRLNTFSGFYRKRPAAGNIWFIVMEVWNVALSVGFMLARSIKMIVIGLLFIARTDTPFLAPGVGYVGRLNLDHYPVTFKRDLLLHDAHRHCWIERLGVMYLLKLKHRDQFATRGGSCWRLLWVLIFMPWMHKYRALSDAGMIDGEIQTSRKEDSKMRRQSIMLSMGRGGEVEVLKATNISLKDTVAEMADTLKKVLAENESLKQNLLQLQQNLPSSQDLFKDPERFEM